VKDDELSGGWARHFSDVHVAAVVDLLPPEH
jgi:hypothetical protein